MGSFDELPYVFQLAKVAHEKTTLTYDEYNMYLKIWNDMSDDMKKAVKSLTKK